MNYKKSKLRTITASLCILGVAALWTTSGYVTKHVVSSNEDVNEVFYSFYQLSHNTVYLFATVLLAIRQEGGVVSRYKQLLRHIKLKHILAFSLMRITSLLLYNLGVQRLVMSTSALLSASSPVFSFVFGLVLREVGFSWRAVLGVIFAVTGTVLTLSSSSDDNKSSSILGGALILSSCAICSLASCFLSRWLKEERWVNDILGIYGLIALTLSVPVLGLCHITRWELFSVPSGRTLLIMSLNALLGNVITNFLMAVALVILGPVIVAVGLTSQALMAAAVDHVHQHSEFGVNDAISIVLVIAAVMLVSFGQTRIETAEECTKASSV